MKWITALILSVVATVALATPEAESLQINSPSQGDFYVNPDARVTLKYKVLPDEFTGPVMIKIWLDDGFVGTVITNSSDHSFPLGVLTPGEHHVVLEAKGKDGYSITEPVKFSVRRPTVGEIGNIQQLP